jgi:hypothetical protein
MEPVVKKDNCRKFKSKKVFSNTTEVRTNDKRKENDNTFNTSHKSLVPKNPKTKYV